MIIQKILSKFKRKLFPYFQDSGYRKWFRQFSGRLESYRNIHQGEECFIIGNGPSLKKINMDLLNNCYTIGTNKIFLLFDKTTWRPNYHVSIDHQVIDQSVLEFNELNCPSFISYDGWKNYPLYNKKINLIKTKWGYDFWNGNLDNQISEGHTVTYVALQLAAFMGFKKVYLIGIDHSYKMIGSPDQKIILNENDESHFDPNYFKDKLYPQPNLKGSEICYQIAKLKMNEQGIEVFDATIDGKLNIFPKINFEDALQRIKKK